MIVKKKIDDRKVTAPSTLSMTARQRRVMEARAETLTAIEGFAASQGHMRSRSIALLLTAQAVFVDRQGIEAKRDAGEKLTVAELVNLAEPLTLTVDFQIGPDRIALANDRKSCPTVKRSSLYEWFKARDAQGVLALAPIPPKLTQPIPAGFMDFLRHYALPLKPSVVDAFKAYEDEAAKTRGIQKNHPDADAMRVRPAQAHEQH